MESSGFIETEDFGPIYTTQMGTGSELIVIHGGPGLEHSYLVEPLRVLSNKRKLIFYDQVGCGEDNNKNNINLQSMVLQLKALLSNILLNNKKCGIIAHSWGTHLALELLSAIDPSWISELFFINPFPLTDERLISAFKRLILCFPTDIQNKIKNLLEADNSEAGLKLMKLITPYYTANPDHDYNMNFKFYNISINMDIIKSLGHFSMIKNVHLLPKKSFVLQGQYDFIKNEDIQELLDSVSQHVTLEKSGHYPFVEEPNSFREFIDSIFL